MTWRDDVSAGFAAWASELEAAVAAGDLSIEDDPHLRDVVDLLAGGRRDALRGTHLAGWMMAMASVRAFSQPQAWRADHGATTQGQDGPSMLGLDEEDVTLLHRVYLAARHLMIGGGWTRDQDAALQALESAVLAAQDALPYELKG